MSTVHETGATPNFPSGGPRTAASASASITFFDDIGTGEDSDGFEAMNILAACPRKSIE
jgi:hypothetical protein